MRKWLAVLVWLGAGALWAQTLQTAELGDCKLQSGEVIRHCKVAYRTFGTLNAEKSNAVLVPTWFGGNSGDWVGGVQKNHLPDPDKYYVIVVDALANGYSSSPSNSAEQPRSKFPAVSIGDMVESQHALLTQKLGISHLRAVMGVSMGGMQTFQWVVAHPEFMDKAVPMMGSPRLAPYDLTLWQAELDAVRNDPAFHDGEYTQQPGGALVAALQNLALTTPSHFNGEHSRDELAKAWAADKQGTEQFDGNNRIRQLQAMMGLDVSAAFGGDMQKAAAAVKAKVLVIVGAQDHMVTPGPARDFAKLMGAKVLELPTDCGHLAPVCQTAEVKAAVDAFLAE